VQTDAPSQATRVLVMIDQPLIAEVIELTLNHGVYATRKARDLVEATEVLAQWEPHLAVVDMDIGGDRLVQQMDHSATGGGTRIPTLALTRRGDLRTKLAAFEQGVDDIMTIPFSPEELLARVLVITRRSYGVAVRFNPVQKLGELEIDILQRQVRAGTSELHLTGLEQSLLYLLAANAGRLVTRDEILDALWGVDYVAGSNVVDRHIRNLRAKLQNDWRKPRFIATVPGQGYRFLPTFTEAEGPLPTIASSAG
jgi:DNA-binding response OmpR family regulator